MPDNIWLYGFDGFNGLKTVGFVVADTDTEAEHKIWQMYNDFGTDEYDLDDLVVWQPKNDEDYREDYPDVMEIVYQKGVNKMNQNDKTEFMGCIIDIFEDFLDEKDITLEPPKESDEMELDGGITANIYGSDYDSISDSLEALLRRWKVIE